MSKLAALWKNREQFADQLFSLMDKTPKFGWVVGIVLMLLSLYPKLTHDLSSDAMFYLYMAGRMLDGAQYYTDFFEYNTPFAIGIYVIPVALARLIGAFVPTMGVLFTTALILLSVATVHTIIIRCKQWQSIVHYNALIIALFFCLNFLSTFYYNITTTKSIVYLCFVLPYFFSVYALSRSVSLARWQHVTVGVLLGLAVCLKPHYALFPIVMEIYMALKLRRYFYWFRFSNILGAAVAIGFYLIILPLFFSGYIKIIPIFFEYYDAAYVTMWDKLVELIVYAAHLFPLWLWYVALGNQKDTPVQYGAFFAAICASILILTTESLLSSDQQSLFSFFVALPLLYSILVFSRRMHKIDPPLSFVRTCMAVFALIFASVSVFGMVNIVRTFDPTKRAEEHVTRQMVEYVKRYAPDDYVYSITDNTQHYAPAMIYLEPRPYPVLHLQRMLNHVERNRYKYKDELMPAGAKEAARYLMDNLIDDMRKQPKLVFVNRINSTGDRYGHCLPPFLDLLLERSPEFREIWVGNYEKVGTITEASEVKIFDERLEREVRITFDGENRNAKFPPIKPLVAWLDVYVRKD